MGYSIVNKDITKIQADIIVNAANGIGYMGGIIGKYLKLKGVAESIHYATGGRIEKKAKKVARKNNFLIGYKPGEIFITKAGNLKASYIIHAVTMRFPGMHCNISIVKMLVPKIISMARNLKAKSIAIPMIGTGTGGVKKREVLQIYKYFFEDVNDIKIIIAIPHKDVLCWEYDYNNLNEKYKSLCDKVKNLEKSNSTYKDLWLHDLHEVENLETENLKLKNKFFICNQYKGRDYFENNQKTLKFFNLKEIEFTQQYDCVWSVDVLIDKKKTNIKFTLIDGYHNNYAAVMKELVKCTSLEDAKKIDQHDRIWYD